MDYNAIWDMVVREARAVSHLRGMNEQEEKAEALRRFLELITPSGPWNGVALALVRSASYG